MRARVVPTRREKEPSEQETDRNVEPDEDTGRVGEPGSEESRHGDDEEHDQEAYQAVLLAIGVVAVGKERVRRPDPPDRNELEGEDEGVPRVEVAVVNVRQVMGDHADARDEHEVEEQFQPRSVAPLCQVHRLHRGSIVLAEPL